MTSSQAGKIILQIIMFSIFIQGVSADASASFASSAVIAGVTFDNNFVQNTTPVANGNDVEIMINISYNGSGILNITVAQPVNFPTGFSWKVNESGTMKNITDLGPQLFWEANFSKPGGILTFLVPTPVIAVASESLGSSGYEKTVNIGSESHLLNVSASTAVDSRSSGFRLYEMNGSGSVEVSDKYGLTIADSTASWSGFNLSTKTFRITGRGIFSESLPSSGGGGGGKYFFPKEDVPEEISRDFHISTHWISESLMENESRTFTINVTNTGNRRQTFTVRNLAEILELEQSRLTILPKETKEILVRFAPPGPGIYEDRIVVSNSFQTMHVYFSISVLAIERPEKEIQEPDGKVAPGFTLSMIANLTVAVLAIVLLSTAILYEIFPFLKTIIEKFMKKEKPGKKNRKKKGRKRTKRKR